MATEQMECTYLLQTDSNYAEHAMVTMLSVHRKSAAGRRNVFYIIDDGIRAELRGKMEELAQKEGFALHFLDCSDVIAKLEKHRVPKWRGGYTTYLKLFAFSRIPGAVQVLYLDCDIIATGDISAAFDENADMTTPLAVAKDMTVSPNPIYKSYLFGNTEETYYNAGVILCNLPLWQAQDCEEKLLAFLEENRKKLMYCEQDIINLLFRGNITALSNRYNFCTPQLFFGARTMGKLFGWSEREIAEYAALEKDYAAGHCFSVFCGRPWHRGSRHPLTAEYAAYYREIFGKEFCGAPVPARLGDKLQYLLYRCCRPLYILLHNIFTRRYYRNFVASATKRENS